MKRIFLFLVTNLAVVFVLSLVARVLGLDRYLAANGGSLGGLLAMAALFGFGGAIISLLMSKWSAKRMMGAKFPRRSQVMGSGKIHLKTRPFALF